MLKTVIVALILCIIEILVIVIASPISFLSYFPPVEKINGDILFLTSTNDESVPAKRDAELLVKRLERSGFKHGYRHINSEIGSHNLGIFPVNNNMLPREKKYPNECQKAREETLDIILSVLNLWKVL